MIKHQESQTAKLCAFARGWHSNTAKQKLFDDYLAYDMMGGDEFERQRALIRDAYTDGSPEDFVRFVNTYFVPIPLARIRFTEDRLAAFAGDRVQYVICGAGADTFSFRNADPDIEIFEVDHPDTQLYKLGRIRELQWNIPKNVHFVPVDFERETMIGKLLQAGFRPGWKTFFSILGVSYYLTLPVFTKTLEQIAALSALGSVLVFDYPEKGASPAERVTRLAQITHSLGEPMQGGFRYNDVSRALFGLGFQIDTFLPPARVQETYFQNRSDGLTAFENVNLLSAVFTNGRSYE